MRIDEACELQAMSADPDLVVSVTCDEGYRVAVSDRLRLSYCCATVPSFQAGVHWLRRQIRLYYPTSQYAARLREMEQLERQLALGA